MKTICSIASVLLACSVASATANAQSCINGRCTLTPPVGGYTTPAPAYGPSVFTSPDYFASPAGRGAPSIQNTNYSPIRRSVRPQNFDAYSGDCRSGYPRYQTRQGSILNRYQGDPRSNPNSIDLRTRFRADQRWDRSRPVRDFSPAGRASEGSLHYRDNFGDAEFRARQRFDRRLLPAQRGGARPASVTWSHDIRAAARQARQARRPMIVRVTADWCSYCQRMKKETFTHPQVLGEISGGYVPVIVDADRNSEIVSQLGVRSLPTTLVISSDLRVVERMEGFRSSDQLSQSLRRHFRNAEAAVGTKVCSK